jgi:DNA-binding MarR family transcriptional regulator
MARPHKHPDFPDLFTLVEALSVAVEKTIADELARLGIKDVNPPQALILYRLGDQEITPNELKRRGIYLGSNISYNQRLLVDNGYLHKRQCPADARSVLLKVSETGRNIGVIVAHVIEKRREETLRRAQISPNELSQVLKYIEGLTKALHGQIRHI